MSSVTAKPLQRSPIVMNIYGRANNQVLEADQHESSTKLVLSSGGELLHPEVGSRRQRHARVHQRRGHDGQDRGADVQHLGGRRAASSFGEDIDMGTEVRLCLSGFRLQKKCFLSDPSGTDLSLVFSFSFPFFSFSASKRFLL